MGDARVAYITTVPVWGGAELNLFRLIKRLVQVDAFPSAVLIHSGSILEKRFRALGIPVNVFSLFAWDWHCPWRYMYSIFQLTHPLIASGANLVHINHHYAIEYTTRAATLSRRPYLVHLRGLESLGWMQKNLPYLSRATRVVPVSHIVKARLIEGGVPETKIEMIYDGIDVANYYNHSTSAQVFREREWKATAETKLVGIVGRITPIKGIADFLCAAAKVTHNIPHIRFVVVGTGPDAYIREMKQLALDLGIRDRVEFTGFRDDIPQILCALDALVLATNDPVGLREEACPNIVLEAMASHVPVVATRSGGAVELLDDGRGLLVTPGDPDGLAQAIQTMLIMSEDARRTMEERAYRAVLTQFTIQEQARHLQELYRQIRAENSFARVMDIKTFHDDQGSLS